MGRSQLSEDSVKFGSFFFNQNISHRTSDFWKYVKIWGTSLLLNIHHYCRRYFLRRIYHNFSEQNKMSRVTCFKKKTKTKTSDIQCHILVIFRTCKWIKGGRWCLFWVNTREITCFLVIRLAIFQCVIMIFCTYHWQIVMSNGSEYSHLVMAIICS